MVEERIENKLIEKMRTALEGNNIHIVGGWEYIKGKGVEPKEANGVLAVAVNPIEFDSYGSPLGYMMISFALTIRADLDPSGDILLKSASAIQGELFKLQIENNGEDLDTDFDISGKFHPSGIKITGGSSPDIDATNKTYIVTWSLLLNGRVDL